MTSTGSALTVGDVFAIPLGDGTFSPGQVVHRYLGEAFFVVVFDTAAAKLEDLPPVKAVADLPPLFLALTFDAQVVSGEWPILGSVDPLHLRLPEYKSSVLDSDRGIDGFQIESADGRDVRMATPEEAERLEFRKFVSPVLLQNAVRAHRGLGTWHPNFDTLLYTRST